MNPREELLMRLTKEQLLYKACEYRMVSVKHNKSALVKAIAEKELAILRAISKP